MDLRIASCTLTVSMGNLFLMLALLAAAAGDAEILAHVEFADRSERFVNVRESPSLDAPILVRLGRGDAVKIDRQRAVDAEGLSWLRLIDRPGWVALVHARASSDSKAPLWMRGLAVASIFLVVACALFAYLRRRQRA